MRVKDLTAATEWVPSRRPPSCPKISVLMPTFRRGADGLFRRAVESILAQTLPDLELIIVDDGSTDGTRSIIDDLMRADTRISCLVHPSNVGLPAVSEFEALVRARGNYLGFGFDDFVFEPEAIQLLIKHIEFEGAQVGHGHIILKNSAGERPCIGRCDDRHGHIRYRNFIGNASVVMDRSIVYEVGFYDPHIAMSRLCDWDLWLRIRQAYRIVEVPVAVGFELGESRPDSLVHSYPLDFQVMHEFASIPRNHVLVPGTYLDRDVWQVPWKASIPLEKSIHRLQSFFSTRSWAAQLSRPSSSEPVSPGASARADPPGSGRPLVTRPFARHRVSAIYSRPAPFLTLYLPEHGEGSLEASSLLEPDGDQGFERIVLCQADAAIFPLSSLMKGRPGALDLCARIGVPHFCLIDWDPFIGSEVDQATPERLAGCETDLASFEAILAPSFRSASSFASSGLHRAVHHVRPIFDHDLMSKLQGIRARARPFINDGIKIGLLPGIEMSSDRMPRLLPSGRPVDARRLDSLVGAGDGIEAVQELIPFEDRLERWSAWRPHAVLCSSTSVLNSDFDAALLTALYLGAVPIILSEPQQATMSSSRFCLSVRSDEDEATWAGLIDLAADAGFRAVCLDELRRYLTNLRRPSVGDVVLARLGEPMSEATLHIRGAAV